MCLSGRTATGSQTKMSVMGISIASTIAVVIDDNFSYLSLLIIIVIEVAFSRLQVWPIDNDNFKGYRIFVIEVGVIVIECPPLKYSYLYRQNCSPWGSFHDRGPLVHLV